LLRVRCEPACEREAACHLRARDACINESCDGDVRKLNKSDLALTRVDVNSAITARRSRRRHAKRRAGAKRNAKTITAATTHAPRRAPRS
jgi:hypothetical protein